MEVAPYSPRARAKASTVPARMPWRHTGIRTRQKIQILDLPRVAAASASVGSKLSKAPGRCGTSGGRPPPPWQRQRTTRSSPASGRSGPAPRRRWGGWAPAAPAATSPPRWAAAPGAGSAPHPARPSPAGAAWRCSTPPGSPGRIPPPWRWRRSAMSCREVPVHFKKPPGERGRLPSRPARGGPPQKWRTSVLQKQNLGRPGSAWPSKNQIRGSHWAKAQWERWRRSAMSCKEGTRP